MAKRKQSIAVSIQIMASFGKVAQRDAFEASLNAAIENVTTFYRTADEANSINIQTTVTDLNPKV
jgi:hypothetical protein